jgi:hypothetical protein
MTPRASVALQAAALSALTLLDSLTGSDVVPASQVRREVIALRRALKLSGLLQDGPERDDTGPA